MEKLKVYVQSFEMPTVGFVDKEGAMHACAEATSTAFKGLERQAGLFGNRYLADQDRDALNRVESFCKYNCLEFDVVDVGTLGFFEKLGMRLRGLKTPAICYGERAFRGIPTEGDLRQLMGDPLPTI